MKFSSYKERRKSWPLQDTINKIIEVNEDIAQFWSNSHGWAPSSAADLLEKSRLDWQVSLSHTLHRWVDAPEANAPDHDGSLILAWTNIGTLVENTMKLFLSVYLTDYRVDEKAIMYKGKVVDPDGAKFYKLIVFFKDKIWMDEERDDRNQWVTKIQQRRNAIHAYKNREIGSFEELHQVIREYLDLIEDLNVRLPRPDY
ncbi:hypothetical protein COLU111180_20620 [Cohnella lubricantis]|uniref:hypothetical protein n=1 Tax=Cohnella lubricantis TaxID=2163172 RepID=UPI001FDA5E3D|nr:hypothetical protein [Cohnella lubricantis]MBP2120629.1 hypothetical protein [Cohnella lubricantis]